MLNKILHERSRLKTDKSRATYSTAIPLLDDPPVPGFLQQEFS